MSIEKIKKLQAEKGFTIVELLIVIVIIGILAAIVIVAYTGITSQANASAAKANAQGVSKVAEAFNADDNTAGGYPTLAQLIAYNSYSKIPAGVTVSANAPNNSKNQIGYRPNTAGTGACIAYWDYKASPSPAVAWYYVGAASTGTAAATSPYAISACS